MSTTLIPSAADLASLLPDPILLVTRDGTLLEANPAAREWLGLGRGPLREVRLRDVTGTPPEAVERLLERFARTREILPGALTWRRPGHPPTTRRCDGGLVQPATAGGQAVILLRCREAREATAGFVALNDQVAALTREVASRKRAEADLFAQREWFRVTLSSIGDAVIATDRTGAVTFMNAVGETLTGWPTPEAVSQPLGEIFRIVDEDTRRRVENPVEDVLRRGAVVGLANHTLLIARDGVERPIEDSAAPIRDAEGRVIGVVLVFHDVTARRQDEIARGQLLLREQAARAEAEAAVQAREAFLARASHELRTPLTSALGTIRLLGRAMTGQLREDPATLLEIAQRNLDAMLVLINGLLDASKLAAGQEPLHLEPVDLAAVARSSSEMVAADARDRGVLLETRVPEGLVVQADRFKLEQVLLNLLANALKHSQAGGSVVIDGAPEAGGTALRVRDRGEGIPREHLAAIFEPFFQVRTHAGRRPRGTGLGLTICRQIVALHGGRIWAESEGPGTGSVFTVWVPAAPDDRQPATVPSPPLPT